MASGRARWASRISAEHLTLTWPRQPCHRRIGRSVRPLWAGRNPARKDSQSGGGPRALTVSDSNEHSTPHSPTCRLRGNGRPSCKRSWRTCNACVQTSSWRSAEYDSEYVKRREAKLPEKLWAESRQALLGDNETNQLLRSMIDWRHKRGSAELSLALPQRRPSLAADSCVSGRSD